MRKTIEAAGLRCESCHYNFRELKENLAERIAFAKELGLKQMVLSSFGLRADATLADWPAGGRRAQPDRRSSRARPASRLGYHNHNNEFKELDGVLIYDELMRTFDPQAGQDAVSGGRHQPGLRGRDLPGQISGPLPLDAPGRLFDRRRRKPSRSAAGVVDWKKLFAAAKTGGVKNYFVEMNLDAMGPSYTYLHGLK